MAWLLACIVFAGCQSTGTESMVAVRAQADPAYVSSQEPALTAGPGEAVSSSTRETYVFTKGRYFPSMFDSRIQQVEFDAMVRTLGTHLRPRFVSTSNPSAADLVIAVHWGAVVRPERTMDTLLYDPDTVRQASQAIDEARTTAQADMAAGNYLTAAGRVAAAEANYRNELLRADSVFTSDARAEADAAELIGARGLFVEDDPSIEAERVRSLVDDDRYFVSLIAFDAKAMRLKQRRVVWTARMSVPVRGRTFADAVSQMAAVAGPYFGTNQRQMVLAPATPAAPVQAAAEAAGRGNGAALEAGPR